MQGRCLASPAGTSVASESFLGGEPCCRISGCGTDGLGARCRSHVFPRPGNAVVAVELASAIGPESAGAFTSGSRTQSRRSAATCSVDLQILERKQLMTKLARDVMTPGPACCTPHTTLDEVVSTMEKHQIRRVPVVDERGCCTGIIAQADVARTGAEHEVAELVREVSRETGHESRARAATCGLRP